MIFGEQGPMTLVPAARGNSSSRGSRRRRAEIAAAEVLGGGDERPSTRPLVRNTTF